MDAIYRVHCQIGFVGRNGQQIELKRMKKNNNKIKMIVIHLWRAIYKLNRVCYLNQVQFCVQLFFSFSSVLLHSVKSILSTGELFPFYKLLAVIVNSSRFANYTCLWNDIVIDGLVVLFFFTFSSLVINMMPLY